MTGMEIIGFGILALLIFTVGFIAGAKFVASDPANRQEPARYDVHSCPLCGTPGGAETQHSCIGDIMQQQVDAQQSRNFNAAGMGHQSAAQPARKR